MKPNLDLPILMTASVSTRGMKGACFTDEEREAQYADALTFYIRELLPRNRRQKIVFVDNSGWDLDHLKKRLPPYPAERLEFISLAPEGFDISRGKGYNEMLLIRGGCNNLIYCEIAHIS